MNLELIKEKIAWYKLLFTVLVTITVGSVSWIVKNYLKAFPPFVIIDFILAVSFSIGIIFSIVKVRFYFKKLGEKENV